MVPSFSATLSNVPSQIDTHNFLPLGEAKAILFSLRTAAVDVNCVTTSDSIRSDIAWSQVCILVGSGSYWTIHNVGAKSCAGKRQRAKTCALHVKSQYSMAAFSVWQHVDPSALPAAMCQVNKTMIGWLAAFRRTAVPSNLHGTKVACCNGEPAVTAGLRQIKDTLWHIQKLAAHPFGAK